MSNASELGALLYELETNWGEATETFATHRIPNNGIVDVSGLKHDKINPNALVQTLQGGPASWILGPQSGSFTTTTYLTGHGSVPGGAGAVTLDAMETWLKQAFGNATVTAANGDTATGGTATVPTTTSSATFAPGGLFRQGTGGIAPDARGNGQTGVVATHIVHALTSLVAFDAGASNGDILKPCVNFYLPEDPLDASAQITGMRYEILTANYRYRCHGCFASSFKISGFGAGELPSIQVTWTVSWWEYSAAAGAFPSAVTSNRYNPAPTANGTFFLAPVGTTTRTAGTTLRNVRSVSIDVTLGVSPLPGINGVSPYQTIVGAVRVPSQVKVSWTEDSGAAADSPELDGFFMGTTPYHLLFTLNPIDGKSVAFYFPNICYTGPRPTQKNMNRVNRVSIEAMAYTGPDTTSQLSQSAMRMGFS